MSELLIWAGVLLLSLALLVKAAGYFTRAAEDIGLFFGLPQFIVGVTIVAVGTSLPELISSILAVFRGTPEIVVGNAVGSNITNVLLVLGIVAIVGRKLKLTYELTRVDLPILIGATFLATIFLYDGVYTRVEGILSLLLLAVYLRYILTSGKEVPDKTIAKEMKDVKPLNSISKPLLMLALSGAFIYLGAEYTVQSVIKLSTLLGLGADIISVSIIALGTSLPELVVSVTAASKGKVEMAVGNVLGSNIFNLLGVLAIPALVAPLLVTESMLLFSIPMMVVSTLLFFFITMSKVITRWEGYMLVIFYAVFIGKVFNMF